MGSVYPPPPQQQDQGYGYPPQYQNYPPQSQNQHQNYYPPPPAPQQQHYYPPPQQQQRPGQGYPPQPQHHNNPPQPSGPQTHHAAAPPSPRPSQGASQPRLFPQKVILFVEQDSIFDGKKFFLGPSKGQRLFAVEAKKDALQRPKMTIHAGPSASSKPMVSIKSKGLKDAMMSLIPPNGSGPQVEEKLHAHYGLTGTSTTFTCPINTRTETFEFKKSSGGAMGLSESLKLTRKSNNEVVGVWKESSSGGLSGTKTGTFEFVGAGASGELGQTFEMMAVAGALRRWHEDFAAAKAVMEALGGA